MNARLLTLFLLVATAMCEFGSMLNPCGVAAIAAPPATDARSPAPSTPAIGWEKRGASAGRPLVFLPPLGFPGRIWERVYSELEKTNPVYVVSLAGTDGVAATSAPYLERATKDMLDRIRAEKVAKPVLVGHLIGAHIALRAAAEASDDLGGVVALPVLVSLPDGPPRVQAVEALLGGLHEVTDEMWPTHARLLVKQACSDPDLIDKLVEMLAKADRRTYTGFFHDMLMDDLKPRLTQVRVPVLLMSNLDPPSKMQNLARQSIAATELTRNVTERMREIYPGIARCDLELIRDSQVFVMYEQPKQVIRRIERFVAKLDETDARWQSTVDDDSGGPDKP